MAKIIEKIIDNFSGGMTNDPRKKDDRFCRIVKHFDIQSNKGRLVPYSNVAAEAAANTEKLCQFVSANSKQYALGVVSATSRAKIFERATLPSGAWAASTTGEDATGTTRIETMFIEYKDVLYGASYINSTTTQIWSYAYLTSTFTDAAQDLGSFADLSASNTGVSALVHSKDDILYIAYDNRVIKNNAGSWSSGIILPTNQVITSICEYGNYLAVGCKSKYSGGKSIAYLWDRDSSVATLSEKIDFGTGRLQILEELDGELIAVLVTTSTAATLAPKIVFKYRFGNGAKQFAEIPSTNVPATSVGTTKQKVNNRLLFQAGIQISGIQQNGIFSIGRNEDTGILGVSIGWVLSTAISDTAFFVPKGFQLLDDYMTVTYDNSGYVTQLTDGSTYSSPSVYESLIQNFGDSDKTKKLIGATVMFEPLPADGQVILKYKINEEAAGTWYRIFKYTTDSAISHAANRIEIGSDTVTMTIASPAVVTLNSHDLVAGQTIVFRTTGALPTGVTAGTVYYVLSTDLATNTFKFSATSGGSAVNTSGSQSGTHTLERDANLREFKEAQFRVESTGGAVITGLKLKVEEIDKSPI